MEIEKNILNICPVLSSSDISRDSTWYRENVGFESLWNDNMYAVLLRDSINLYLQWHAGTNEDLLNGGSVVRIFVRNIKPLSDEFVERGTVQSEKLILSTP